MFALIFSVSLTIQGSVTIGVLASAFEDGKAIVVEVDWHAISERVLQSGTDLCCFEGILWLTSQRLVVQNSVGKLGKINLERRSKERKSIWHRACADPVPITNLDIRGSINDSVCASPTYSCHVLEAVGESAAKVGGENLAVSKLDHAPSIIAVAILGQIIVDSLLTHSNNSIDLFLRVDET